MLVLVVWLESDQKSLSITLKLVIGFCANTDQTISQFRNAKLFRVCVAHVRISIILVCTLLRVK